MLMISWTSTQLSSAMPSPPQQHQLVSAWVKCNMQESQPLQHGDNSVGSAHAHELVLFLTWIATLCASQLAT